MKPKKPYQVTIRLSQEDIDSIKTIMARKNYATGAQAVREALRMTSAALTPLFDPSRMGAHK